MKSTTLGKLVERDADFAVGEACVYWYDVSEEEAACRLAEHRGRGGT